MLVKSALGATKLCFERDEVLIQVRSLACLIEAGVVQKKPQMWNVLKASSGCGRLLWSLIQVL